MSEAEQTYKELVGEEGHSKVVAVAEIWSLPEDSRELLFSCCLNAYWRGANKGIDECRALLRKREVPKSGQPIN